MTRAVTRWVGRLIWMVVLVGVAWAGWRWGDHVFPALEARLGLGQAEETLADGPAVSEALGQSALEKVERLLDGGQESVSLTGPEITSLLRHTRPQLVPSGLREPEVRLADGRARASARVALADYPGLPDLGPAAAVLPDTVEVQVEGSIMGFGDGEAAIVTSGAHVAGVPIPRRLIPQILDAMGRQDRPGLPPDAITVALPPGVGSAYVEGDRLVLVSDG